MARLHLAVDDHSRLAYSEIFPDERRKSCLRFLFNALRFFRSHGVKVYRVMTEFEGSGNDPGDHFPAEQGKISLKEISQSIENAWNKTQAHQVLHPEDQRQGLNLTAALEPMALDRSMSRPRCANGPMRRPIPTQINAAMPSHPS